MCDSRTAPTSKQAQQHGQQQVEKASSVRDERE
jgi:hypothetical protein